MLRTNEEVQKYFLDALRLFHETQWIYNHPVTEILIRGSLDAIPVEWLELLQNLENEEFNNFVVSQLLSQWPKSLETFVTKCNDVNKLSSTYRPSTLKIPQQFIKGLNPKKQHEIVHLAELVHSQCTSLNIDVIVDFGSGLGYVCQLLHYLYGYRVLGLEGNKSYVIAARNRQKTMYPTSEEHVKYAYYKLVCDSVEPVESILQIEFKETKNVCLIGLHTCGDLSAYASKIFYKMKKAQLLILMPCCYHKLATLEVSKNTQYFCNFPLSESLQDTIKLVNFNVGEFLRQPFLRLACQETTDRWKNMSTDSHNAHAIHVLARAVLELYAKQNKLTLKKRVRKATRISQCSNIESYVKDCLSRYIMEPVAEIEDKSYSCDETVQKIMELWESHHKKLKDVEIYTALQLILQAPAESLILQDHLCWLQEHDLEAITIPVMNRTLSPRSNAIVARKKKKI